MKYGVVFPQTEIGADPIAVRDYAQAAEALGYAYMIAYDHVVGAYRPNWPGRMPYNHESLFHEVFVLFGYLAGQTERLELATGILILPQRQTALVAKQAAAVDVLTGGRLRLGVGIGWNPVEYETLGQNFKTRGRRIEEQVTLLRQLWTQPLVTFQGEFDQIEDAGLNPLPIQQPIPVWMGGMADVVLRRMARMADGWFLPTVDTERTQEAVATMHRYLDEAGRPRESFGLDQRLILHRTPQDEWQTWIDTRYEMGLTDFAVYPAGDTPQTLIDSLRTFQERTEWR